MKAFLKTRFVQHFLPFMIIVIGGSFFIREFTKLRYKYRRIETLDSRQQVKELGINTDKRRTLEEHYEDIKKLDIDNWKNVRIPRPWEEPSSTTKN